MEMFMIEFKGSYYKRTKANATAVLVQFDGVLLHVWHLSDPFYRLLSSDVFHLSSPLFKGRPRIKLPNGGLIETEDVEAIDALQQPRRQINSILSHLRRLWTICFFVAFVALGLWFFVGQGLS